MTPNITARGSFEVNLAPLEPYNKSPEARQGRMSIDKTFHGDLEATSKGEMVSALSAIEGSAAYGAVEFVSGNLRGRKGSFSLVHQGISGKSGQQLNVVVVPDSGTLELEGLSGTMTIEIKNGKHSYEFHYSLPPRP
jgi:Protein of unknown function (DUF3224)